MIWLKFVAKSQNNDFEVPIERSVDSLSWIKFWLPGDESEFKLNFRVMPIQKSYMIGFLRQ
jgi:hypothetical protein